MPKYNLIRNGFFSASGDHDFTWSELDLLQDEVTTSGAVTLASGVNDLVVDLSQRIKVDDIRLYTNDLTKSSNIYFWYKNETDDDYTQLTTDVSSYYYTTIPSPSAPRYVKVTISGVSMDLYEFQIFNDDYIVAYGQDGQQYIEYLENTSIGEEGVAQSIAVYNNSSYNTPVNAYTCLEATGSASDDYIKISSSENGVYYKVTDGLRIDTDVLGVNDFIWSDGTFYNTAVHATNDNVYRNAASVRSSDLGSVPLSDNSASWRVGQNCWDYDSVNRAIYAIGAETTVALKLYRRYIDTGGWSYRGQINIGVTGFESFAVMTYLNGYVYVICNLTGTFGRYDVNGAADNWESLTSVGWSTTPHYIGICSDKNRYVYAMHYYYTDDSHKEFRRYDTTTSGWAAMSNGYTNNAFNGLHYPRRACLAYDYDRDLIYADVGGHHSGNYIQRYDVSANSWNTTWFNVDNYTNATSDYNYMQTHTYYKNYLIFGHAQTGSRVYYYNISTGTISYYSQLDAFYAVDSQSASSDYWSNPFILATDTPTNLPVDTTSRFGIVSVYGANFVSDRNGFYLICLIDDNYGTYKSPIFRLEDKYNSSYFLIKGTTSSPSNSISYDEDVYNGTIKVRSTDTDPLPLIEVYSADNLYVGGGDFRIRISRWIVFTNNFVAINSDVDSAYGSIDSQSMAVNTHNGKYIECHITGSSNNQSSVFYFNRDGSEITHVDKTSLKYAFNKFMDFDGYEGIWGYGDHNTVEGRTLCRLDGVALSEQVAYSEAQQDFVYDMTTEFTLGGCWYTNSIDDTLVHMSMNGTKLDIIPMANPRNICRTTDNGCWVYDSSDKKVYRYDYSGDVISTFILPYELTYGDSGLTTISDDRQDGFWYLYDVLLYHVTSEGIADVGPVTLSNPSKIYGTQTGCLIHSISNTTLYWVNMNGVVAYSRAIPDDSSPIVGMLYYGYDEFVVSKQALLPASYDTTWSNLAWNEVRKDGYYLPKTKYHQVDVKLWNSATLDGIYMAPAIKTEDIQPQQSKNIYVKTDIPLGADISDYSAVLRSWWGIED